jgi:kynureninase
VVGDFRPPDTVRFAPAPLYTRFVDVWDAMAHTRDQLASGSYRRADPVPGRIT